MGGVGEQDGEFLRTLIVGRTLLDRKSESFVFLSTPSPHLSALSSRFFLFSFDKRENDRRVSCVGLDLKIILKITKQSNDVLLRKCFFFLQNTVKIRYSTNFKLLFNYRRSVSPNRRFPYSELRSNRFFISFTPVEHVFFNDEN